MFEEVVVGEDGSEEEVVGLDDWAVAAILGEY